MVNRSIRECDRCREMFENEQLQELILLTKQTVNVYADSKIGEAFASMLKYGTGQVDLCNSCSKDLVVWFHSKPKGISK